MRRIVCIFALISLYLTHMIQDNDVELPLSCYSLTDDDLATEICYLIDLVLNGYFSEEKISLSCKFVIIEVNKWWC